MGNSDAMKWFHRTLVFDFGSANTVVCEKGQIVFDEETIISVWPEGDIDVGSRARMLHCGEKEGFWGKWPAGECNKTYFPISRGHVADFGYFEAYVKGVVKKVARFPRFCSVIIAMPDELSDDEFGSMVTRAFLDPFLELNVNNVRTIPQSVAAAAGLSLLSDKHHLILDIGYGKTRVSLVKDSCVYKTKLLKSVSGESWISAIRTYIRAESQVNFSISTVESALVNVGSAMKNLLDPPTPFSITGPSRMTGHLNTIVLDHKVMADVLNPNLLLLEKELSAFVHEVMAISDDVSRDIISEGIWMIGGGSRLRGMQERLGNKLNITVNTVYNPFHAVARGPICLQFENH